MRETTFFRGVLAWAAAGLGAMAIAGCSAQAQSCISWECIQGGGNSYDSAAAQTPRKPEPLNDLRSGPTPLRSDVMIDAVYAAIDRYEKIAASGGWPVVPKGKMMRLGDDDERVPILRKRLRIEGDMKPKGQYYDSQTFDTELEEGVKRFQSRNGIRPSGRIEQSVYAVLNIPAEQRVAQLKLNLERIRGLMSGGVEDRYVLVNVPGFQLEAVEQHEVQMRNRVIVGRPERQTPDVKAMIKALNFFPYWRVPDSIAMLDLVPRLQKEPEYLANEGIRVFDGYNGPEIPSQTINWFSPEVAKYKFKQDPGPKNALGLLRLDMQNEHGVYMHDTPMKNLFDQRSRPFSAGCVRVQDVFQLADWIARYEPGWDKPGQAERFVAAGQAVDVELTRPVPVYFTYITAWADPQAKQVQFRPDIYNRDGEARVAFEHDVEDAPPPGAAAALAP